MILPHKSVNLFQALIYEDMEVKVNHLNDINRHCGTGISIYIRNMEENEIS